MTFEQLPLDPRMLKGIKEMGFTKLTPVQERTLKVTLTGLDAAVQSQTGTGKTAAFLITIFQGQLVAEANRRKALIIAPTRELAVQIEAEAKLLGRHLRASVGCFYGGVGYNHQEALLKRGVDIMVGTPGRLLDLEGKGTLSMRDIGFLVIDEADRLFDMGFLPDLRQILRRVPPRQRRQTMLFSATLSEPAMRIARDNMNRPEHIEITPEQVTVDTITQELYHVGSREKFSLLLGILKREKPRSVLFFTNMKVDAERLCHRLVGNGYRCEFLTGDLPQSRRLRIINDFKSGRVFFLVATDVAARGLHIDDLDMVVNFDLPADSENYVHRIGRTARAGKNGKAVSLACERYVSNLDPIEKLIHMKIPAIFAEEHMFLRDKSRGMDVRSTTRPRGPESRSRRPAPSHGPSRSGGLKNRPHHDPRKSSHR
jgi:ATP-dependent RNA helicase RhlB